MSGGFNTYPAISRMPCRHMRVSPSLRSLGCRTQNGERQSFAMVVRHLVFICEHSESLLLGQDGPSERIPAFLDADLVVIDLDNVDMIFVFERTEMGQS